MEDLIFMKCAEHGVRYPSTSKCPACERNNKVKTCNLKECNAGDPYLAKKGGPRFPEASCCHQHVIKGKKVCIS